MLEPLGTLVFLLPVVAFIGIMTWLIITKHLVLRIVLAMLAFLPAMTFGFVIVNRYYQYYPTWTRMYNDLSGQGDSGIPQAAAEGIGNGKVKNVRQMLATVDREKVLQGGYYFKTMVTGPKSHITREVIIYLPPQYFEKAYAHYKFPAIELLHGSPGTPDAWINVMGALTTYTTELQDHTAQPAILVMPDTNGGVQYNLQCLNQPGGLQDMTYVGKEVPDWVASPASSLRVQPPGQMWGIAGYSEGGYCAANIALQYASRFGEAGSFSGYFQPDPQSQVPAHNKPGGVPVRVKNFASNPRLLMLNTPMQYIRRFPVGVVVPKFYLAAGSTDHDYLIQMNQFYLQLYSREPNIQTDTPSGGHKASVWSAALTWMLPKMTGDLFMLAQKHQAPPPAVLPVKSKQAPGTQPAPAKGAPPIVNKHP